MLSDSGSATRTRWPYVNKRTPCPACGRPDWCQISPDGGMVLCRRVQSDRSNKKGDGWYHRNSGQISPPATASLSPAKPQTTHDWDLLTRSCRTALAPHRLQFLSKSLGLTDETLKRLDVGWHSQLGVWTFPMRNAAGKTLGIRTRLVNGQKRAVRGSQSGLFIPRGFTAGRAYLLEGPTDTAAALDLGLNAFGRSSCSADVSLVVEFLKRWQVHDLVIFSQRDTAKLRNKTRPELGVWYPAQDGAARLAGIARLYSPIVRPIMPPEGIKDVRDWLHAGATQEDVEREVLRTPSWKLRVISKPLKGIRQ